MNYFVEIKKLFKRINYFKMFIFILICLIIGFSEIKILNKAKKEIIETNKKDIYGIVDNKISYKGTIWIRFTNNDSIYTFKNCYNRKQTPFELSKSISKGDTIIKKHVSDTIYIYKKNNISNYFIYKPNL